MTIGSTLILLIRLLSHFSYFTLRSVVLYLSPLFYTIIHYPPYITLLQIKYDASKII